MSEYIVDRAEYEALRTFRAAAWPVLAAVEDLLGELLDWAPDYRAKREYRSGRSATLLDDTRVLLDRLGALLASAEAAAQEAGNGP